MRTTRPGPAAGAIAAALIALGVGGCDDPRLAEHVKADIEAVAEVQVSDFTAGNQALGEGTEISLTLPSGQATISTPDLVATILILDEHRAKNRSMRRISGWRIVAGEDSVSVGWTDGRGGSEPTTVSEVSGASGPYDNSYCQLPDLKRMGIEGAGGDFARIGECNPMLEELRIYSWDEATDFERLAELGNLREIFVFGAVQDPGSFPRVDSLEFLQLHLAEDTTTNLEALQSRLPSCSITSIGADGQVSMDAPDVDHTKELFEPSQPRRDPTG
ncbi:MAG: hypothetical protein LBK95_18320 [Bifidobacteriaceae bacterium]|nr:hypothetical protein [Bifidobacteriaceae bacterium]